MRKVHTSRCMAKRLSKALREKRRWLGVLIHPRLSDRSAVEQTLEDLSKTMTTEPKLRLMDFVRHDQRPNVVGATPLSQQHPKGGLAVVRAPLSAVPELRSLLEAETSFDKLGIMGLTTSGKIRLVRQRLGLPRPKRDRR